MTPHTPPRPRLAPYPAPSGVGGCGVMATNTLTATAVLEIRDRVVREQHAQIDTLTRRPGFNPKGAFTKVHADCLKAGVTDGANALARELVLALEVDS